MVREVDAKHKGRRCRLWLEYQTKFDNDYNKEDANFEFSIAMFRQKPQKVGLGCDEYYIV